MQSRISSLSVRREPVFNTAEIGVALAGFSVFLNLYSTQSILPFLASLFHASALEVSQTVGAVTFAVTLAAPFVGPISDLFGRKRIIVIASFALVLLTALVATSQTLSQLIAWRFAQGLLLPAVFGVTVAYIAEEWRGRNVGRAMGRYVAGNVLGGVTGRLISGYVATHLGWRQSFLALGGLSLLSALGVVKLLPASRAFVPEPGLRALLGSLGSHLRNAKLGMTCVVGFNILFSIVATFTYVNFYLAAPPYSLNSAALGLVFLVYIAGIPASIVSGSFLDRVGYRMAFVSAMLVSALGVFLTGFVGYLWGILLGLALCASGIFVCQSAANSYLGASHPRARASAAGIYVSCYYLGGTVGAVAPGLVWAHGGWTACVALILSVQLATVLLVWKFWR